MRTVSLRESLLTGWDRRLARFGRRGQLLLRDLGSDLDWHVRGGRRFFADYWQEVAGSRRWVFIIGCNNSGTSLLQRLLEWTGEVTTFAAEGQLYTRAVRRDRKRGFSRVWTEYLDELALHPGDARASAPRLVHDWMRGLPRPVGPVVLEKTPANAARAGWLQEVFPDSRFVGLVRNGYAVSEGIRRKARQPLTAGARHWNAVNRLLLETAPRVDHYLEVRYEELADDPAGTLLSISRFVGLEGTAVAALAQLDEARARAAMVTTFGPVRNRNPDSIARLSPGEIASVRAEAREMLEFFGYGQPTG